MFLNKKTHLQPQFLRVKLLVFRIGNHQLTLNIKGTETACIDIVVKTDTLLMVYQVVTCFHANFENNANYDNNSSLLIRCEKTSNRKKCDISTELFRAKAIYIYIYIYIHFVNYTVET